MLKSTRSASFELHKPTAANCQECGCPCHSCTTYSSSLDLHREIEELRSKLVKSNSSIEQLRAENTQVRLATGTQLDKLQDEFAKLNDRYARLLEAYKKTQKVNHDLEDKLLKFVQGHDEEKRRLEVKVTTLNSQLIEAKYAICDLEQEAERYRSDCYVAVQLLQCRPSSFVAHRLTTLPLEVQQRVKLQLSRDELLQLDKESGNLPQPLPGQRIIRVAMPTFPPTAMMYSVHEPAASKPPRDPTATADSLLASRLEAEDGSVPLDLIAKVLSPPASTSRKASRFYVCERCSRQLHLTEAHTQTDGTPPPDERTGDADAWEECYHSGGSSGGGSYGHSAGYGGGECLEGSGASGGGGGGGVATLNGGGGGLGGAVVSGYPRPAVANMRTNPPTIITQYPSVHSKNRLHSLSSDCGVYTTTTIVSRQSEN